MLWSVDDRSLLPGKDVTILTTNYDRSLEHYLTSVATMRGHLTPNTATFGVVGPHRTVVAQGPTIIHLYGQLGYLQGKTGVRDYSTKCDADTVRIAAHGLRTLSDADVGSPAFSIAREAIRNSTKVFFLGFGFHRQTVERLFDFTNKKVLRQKIISGTTKGFSLKQWDKVLHDVLRGHWTPVTVGNSVQAFLKEQSVLD